MADEVIAATEGNPPTTILEGPKPAPLPGSDYKLPTWAESFEPDLKGMMQSKRITSEAQLAKNYAEIEKTIGVDKIPVPKDGVWDAAARAKLGIPEKPEGYTIKRPEMPEGVPYDEGLEKAALPILHKLGLTPGQTQGLIDFIAQHRVSELTGMVQRIEQEHNDTEAKLRGEWGGTYDAKVEMAKRAALFMGGEGFLAKLSTVGNDPEVIRAFAKAGALLGEDKLRTGTVGSLSLSPYEAKQEIARIQAQATDPKSAYSDGAHPEHKQLIARLEELYKLASRPAA